MSNTTNIKRLNGYESDTLKRLMVCVQILNSEHDLDKRLTTIPRGKLLWGQARAATTKLLELICDTIPTDQLKSIQKNLECLSYSVGVSRPGKKNKDEYGMWISWRMVEQLGAAAREKCLTCDCDNQTARSCPLAKAMDELPSDKHDGGGGCGYMGLL